MRAEEGASYGTGAAQAFKPASRPPAVLPRKELAYRARNTKNDPLNRLVLNNLQDFEQWLKNPPDNRPRPHPSIITPLKNTWNATDPCARFLRRWEISPFIPHVIPVIIKLW